MGHEYIITLVYTNIKYTEISHPTSLLSPRHLSSIFIETRDWAGGLKRTSREHQRSSAWSWNVHDWLSPPNGPGLFPFLVVDSARALESPTHPPTIPRLRPRTTNSQLLLSGKIWSILVILSKINTFCSIHWSICVGGFNWGRAWTRISGWREGEEG